MGRRGGELWAMRRAGLVLVALALLIRVLVPGGYMAASSATGVPTIVICTGEGALSIAVDADGTVRKTPVDGDDHDEPKTDHPCAFAGAATPLVAPVLALAVAPFVAEPATALRLPPHQRPGLGLAAPPPPTTGPPVLV